MSMRRNVLICLGLLVLNLIGFWPVIHLGFITLDDPAYVSQNPQVQAGITPASVTWAFTSLETGNWHPITWLSHMLDWQLFGSDANGHHVMNLGIHIANTLLLYAALTMLLGFRSANAGTAESWCSAWVAALFAVHPLHVQSVAWIAERKDVLSGFFMMLTLLCYTKAMTRDKGRVARSDSIPSRFYWLSVLFFALGVMSKPMLVSLPIILLLLDFWPLGRIGDNQWRMARFGLPVPEFSVLKALVLEKLPFAGFSLISCLATLRAQGDAGFIIHVAPLPWYTRLIITPYFYLKYLEKILWPENLAIFYPYPLIPLWKIAVAAALLIFLSLLCLRQARVRPYLTVGWFWFLVMLVPVIGLVQVGTQSIADRYTYLPSIGLFIIAAWAVHEAAARSRFWKTGIAIGATAVVLACLADTRWQLRYWQNSITLFTHALDVKRQNNSMCYYCLGNSFWAVGDSDDAVTNYRAALEIAPGMTEAASRLGFILLQQNKLAEAEAQFRNVLQWDPSDTKAHKYLGDISAGEGKLDQAAAEYATVLRLNPGDAVIRDALQPELDKLETARTLTNLYQTLKVQPTAEACVQAAGIETTQKDFQKAVDHYREALRLKPDAPDILNNLAWLLATCPDDAVRNGAEAVKCAGRACELTQNKQPMLLGTLAAAYAESGRFDDAVAAAQKACDLASQQGETLLLQKNQSLLEFYRAHKPWRE